MGFSCGASLVAEHRLWACGLGSRVLLVLGRGDGLQELWYPGFVVTALRL